MKIFLAVLLSHFMCIHFVSAELIQLDPTPFDVPKSVIETGRLGRIVYGSSAYAGQFTHFSLIYVKRSTALVQCGAGLISPIWVVTAKHCIKDAKSVELRFGFTHREYYEQKVNAQALAQSNDVDIAVIKLLAAVRITSLVSFALLPRLSQANELFVNQTATVCGMGLELEQTWAVSTYLQYTDLKIISQQDCAKYFGAVDPKILCAKSPTTLASACSGDSGSPLTIREGINAVIIGVVSFGAGSGCDLGYPVGYVRVAQQLDFIKRYTGITIRA